MGEDKEVPLLVQRVLESLCSALPANERRIILQPVVTKSDLVENGIVDLEWYSEKFAKAVPDSLKDQIVLQDPMAVSSKNNSGMENLVRKLRALTQEQLKSQKMVAMVRRMSADDCLSALKEWHALNPELEAEALLVRRYLEVVAKMHGMKIVNFNKVYPNGAASWKVVANAVKKIRAKHDAKEQPEKNDGLFSFWSMATKNFRGGSGAQANFEEDPLRRWLQERQQREQRQPPQVHQQRRGINDRVQTAADHATAERIGKRLQDDMDYNVSQSDRHVSEQRAFGASADVFQVIEHDEADSQLAEESNGKRSETPWRQFLSRGVNGARR